MENISCEPGLAVPNPGLTSVDCCDEEKTP